MEDFRTVRGDPRVEHEQNRIAISLQRHGKDFDQVALSLDRSESLVQRLTKQIRELQETVIFFQEAAEFRDPEPAHSEVSERTFNSIVNRKHISGANFSSRNVANSFRRDVFESLFLILVQCTLKRMRPVPGASSSSSSQVPVAMPREGPSVSSVASQGAAFQAAAYLTEQKELFPRPAKLAGRNPTPVEDRSISQKSRSLPTVILPPPLEPPIRTTFESSRMSPYDVSYRERDNLEFEKTPTSTFNFWQLNFRTKGCSVSYIHLMRVDSRNRDCSGN